VTNTSFDNLRNQTLGLG